MATWSLDLLNDGSLELHWTAENLVQRYVEKTRGIAGCVEELTIVSRFR
jgi:hypothetical protein